MKRIQILCCSLLVIAASCTGPTAPDPETAHKLYQEAKSLDWEDADRKLELLEQAVEHDPEFTEAHREIIRLTEDKDPLRQEYERHAQENPDSAVFHYLLGEVTEGDAKQDHYEKAIELEPGSTWGYLGLGELMEDRESFDEAFTNYRMVLERDPASELGHRGLARTYGRMGRREDEISAYRKMISELPDIARGYWGLKRAYEKAEQESEAASLLRQIYERFRSDPHNGGLALYELAESMENQDEKVRLWNRFIEDYPAGPNIVHVYDYLMEHYVETDPEKAAVLARECLEKEALPGDKRLKNYAYQALFALYWKSGEARKEEELVQELLDSGYSNPVAYTHVADHYARKGQVELAIRLLERALNFANPESVHGTVLFTSREPSRELLEEVGGQVRTEVSCQLGELLNKNRRHREAITVLLPVVGILDYLGDRIHRSTPGGAEALRQFPD